VKHLTILIAAALFLAACATTDSQFDTGRRMIENGQTEEGLKLVGAAAKAHPDNAEYRTVYVRNRDNYVNQLLTGGDKQRMLGRFDDAEAFYRRVLMLDDANVRAQAGLAQVNLDLRHRRMVAEARALADAGDLDGALERLRPVLSENPSQRDARNLLRAIEEKQVKASAAHPALKSTLRKPVSLEFRDAPLKQAFDVLSRTSGINFVFDRDVRPDLRATMYVRNTRIEDAIRFLLATNQLEQKVLSENTILIYPNLPNKQKDYQELMVKSFYLANADVKQTLNLVKTVVKTRDVFIDDKINLLVMRDTPEAIRLAEKLIAAQDLAEPEVMLEVEVMEVARNRLTELGIRYPSQLAVGVQGAAGPGSVTLAETKGSWDTLTNFTITDPALVLNLKKQDGDTNLLANPRIRVKNREKAKIHIGDKLPVITTTSTANVGVSESVAYLDIGLKLDVEPNVFLEDDVAMKVGLEVSNIVQEIRSANGTLTYRIGTRNTSTLLRLKNGETQVLAGLISDEERNTADKVPGLGDMPVLGRLFGSRKDERNKTEIVLLITPYVVRNLDRPGATTLEFMSGTDAVAGGGAFGLRSADAARPEPLDEPPSDAVPPAQTPLPVRPDPEVEAEPIPQDR
jgi:general secretion pathway protein D